METELTTPIHFLVDFENVHYNGLTGVEYLNEYDKITIFYSDKCPNIIKRDLDYIRGSGAVFDTCRLVHHGKNALDFYIAIRVGEEIVKAQDQDLTIVIVTKDKGFDSIVDYCKMRKKDCTVITAPTIEKGIMNVKGTNLRKSLTIEKTSTVHFSATVDRKKEEITAVKVAKASKLENVDHHKLDILMRAKYDNGRGLYFAIIKEFGMNTGRVLYDTLKRLEAGKNE